MQTVQRNINQCQKGSNLLLLDVALKLRNSLFHGFLCFQIEKLVQSKKDELSKLESQLGHASPLQKHKVDCGSSTFCRFMPSLDLLSVNLQAGGLSCQNRTGSERNGKQNGICTSVAGLPWPQLSLLDQQIPFQLQDLLFQLAWSELSQTPRLYNMKQVE